MSDSLVVMRDRKTFASILASDESRVTNHESRITNHATPCRGIVLAASTAVSKTVRPGSNPGTPAKEF